MSLQFLKVNKNTKLTDLADIVGNNHIEEVLHNNSITRTPFIGKQFIKKCNDIMQNTQPVELINKLSLLNRLSEDEEVFEFASLMDDDSWKVMSEIGTFPGYLNIYGLQVAPTRDILGCSGPISTPIYNQVIDAISTGVRVDPIIFGETNSTAVATNIGYTVGSYEPLEYFKIPWGEVQIYSSIADVAMDIPCYPETIKDGRKANYITMPDLLYQYEPWQIYTGSGPRSITFDFHFHRDMWNGDHTRGGANELIRFCEANCYPEYNGSAVNTATVALLIHGSIVIMGIMTDVSTSWSGPIGLDGWYLDCHLSLSITEVADKPLNYGTVKSLPIIG